MDAVTLVAAAVAVAVDNSRQAALNDLLLKRERAAMRAADLESRAAQRALALADLQTALDAMRGALRQLQARRVTMRLFDVEHMLAEGIDDASEALSSFNVEAAPEA